MSSAGRAASSSGCVARPRGRETGLTGYAEQIQRSLPTGSSAMETAEHREPYESRGSRTDLGAPGGESPPGDSTRRAVPADKAECRLCVEKGDDRRSAPRRARRADSEPSAPRRGTGRFDPWRTFLGPPAIPKSDVRRLQPTPSSHNTDFARLSDFREIAPAEIQICPDDGGRVAVGRIDQIDRPLRQRVLRQQRHKALLPNGHGRQEGQQFRQYVAIERT